MTGRSRRNWQCTRHEAGTARNFRERLIAVHWVLRGEVLGKKAAIGKDKVKAHQLGEEKRRLNKGDKKQEE